VVEELRKIAKRFSVDGNADTLAGRYRTEWYFGSNNEQNSDRACVNEGNRRFQGRTGMDCGLEKIRRKRGRLMRKTMPR